MKKILFITLIIAFTYSLSFALTDGQWGTPEDSQDYKLSNNVEMFYTVDDTTNAQHYGLMTKHYSGDKVYATVDTSSVIYVQTNPEWKGQSGTGTGITVKAGDDGASDLEGDAWDEL
ncbi:MAG: hypothetical protein PWQ25_821 [Deferribacteres bacterium]|nr:hypothetical protein [Deferribacteres bacterium]